MVEMTFELHETKLTPHYKYINVTSNSTDILNGTTFTNFSSRKLNRSKIKNEVK